MLAVVKNMFRLTSQIIQKPLRAERSNLSGVPKDGLVVRLRRTPRNDSLSEPIFDRHYNFPVRTLPGLVSFSACRRTRYHCAK
jgi:hypothetical protein